MTAGCIEMTPLLQVLLTFGLAGLLFFCYQILDLLRLAYLKWKKDKSGNHE